MTERQERSYTIISNTFAIATMVVYGIIKYSFYIASHNDSRTTVLFFICMLGAILGVSLSTYFLRTSKMLAFLNPAFMTTGFTLFAFLTGGIDYIFGAFAVVSIISSAYFNLKYTFIYSIFLHVVIFITLVIFNFPITGYVVETPLHLHWAMVALSNCFLFFLIQHATVRRNASIRGLSSFQVMLSTTPNIVVLVDSLNRVTFLSDELKKLANIDEDVYAIGRPLLDLFPDPNMERGVATVLKYEENHTETIETYVNGELRYYQINSVHVKGDANGKLIDIADVTNIMMSKNEAEKASNAKTNFLSRMSHEIRTPMNAILGMTELAMRENTSDRVRRYVTTIKSSGEHLLSIINDILDFSKIESGNIGVNNSHYLFHSVVQDVVNIVKIQMPDPGVLFVTFMEHDIPDELFGDEVKLRQILLNILRNASKYTKTGYFSLEIYGEKTDDDTIMLTMKVKDTGIGIKPGDMAMLFSEFTQFYSKENDNIEGTGLGLALTRSLTQMMGGTIEATSEYGKGSEFIIKLPQKYLNADIQPPQTEDISAIVYCKTPLVAEYISRTFDDLNMKHIIATSDNDLQYKLYRYDWDYIFTEESLAHDAESIVRALGLTTEIIMLVDSYDKTYEQQGEHNFSMLMMPVYFLPILNLINDVDISPHIREPKLALFTAPEANILVVDDVETNLYLVEGLLAPYGVNVTSCTSGKDAIELIESNNFDLVFMDHMMPNMNGLEAVRIIRKLNNGAYADLPIVALTANAIVGAKEMFLENNLDDFISKPIEVDKLNHVLTKWIPEEKQEREKRRNRVNGNGSEG